MLKKPKAKSKGYYQRKADKIFQEIGRLLYRKCLVCNKELSCLHHYVPKSQSTALRYDFENAIPICVNHHFSHHNGNPDVHARVLDIKGMDWHEELMQKQKKGIGGSYGVTFYKGVYEQLKTFYDNTNKDKRNN